MIEYKAEDILWEGPHGPLPIQSCGSCGTLVTETEYYWKPAKQTFCNAKCALDAYTNNYGFTNPTSFEVTGMRKK